jgi:polyferredoxin
LGNASEEGTWGELYAAHQKIYPRSVQGIFAKWRWGFVFLTQIIFYGLPWLEWGQRQAVLFDLGARRFYIFGIVLYPQDFIYLTGLLVISAFSCSPPSRGGCGVAMHVLRRFTAKFSCGLSAKWRAIARPACV